MWSFVTAVVVVIMVDMVTATGKVTAKKEVLELEGSPQLGYYVQLGLGTPYKVVGILLLL